MIKFNNIGIILIVAGVIGLIILLTRGSSKNKADTQSLIETISKLQEEVNIKNEKNIEYQQEIIKLLHKIDSISTKKASIAKESSEKTKVIRERIKKEVTVISKRPNYDTLAFKFKTIY